MSDQPKKLDFTPLVKSLVDKSNTGKIKWEPTADRKAFIASVGGDTTFKIQLVTITDVNDYGQLENVEVPQLDMIDQKGHLLWDIRRKDVSSTVLWDLFYIARRIGNQIDDHIAGIMNALEKL